MHKLVVLFLFAFAPAVMFAVDGQVLISQSAVMAAGGFPYLINQPGSYKLSGNLVVPPGSDGIHVLVSNVSIDLNGFSITTAPVGLGTYGIGTILPATGGQPSALAIRNGMIRGFQYPIANSIASAAAILNFGTSWTLESLTLNWGYGGIGTVYLGTFGLVEHVSAQDISIAVPCPAVVALTVAAQVDIVASPYSSSTCTFTGNASIYH